MTAPASTEHPADWCRARVLVPGHPLTLTLPYAPAARREQLVVLHTLIGEIASIPDSVADPAVARRKLEWWTEALERELPHPAIQAWRASGLADSLPAARFSALIEAISSAIEPPRFERQEEFDAHCRQVGGAGAWLEALLAGADRDDAALRSSLDRSAGAGYRIRVTRDLVIDARAGRWSVPLDLQAEYRITRQEAAQGDGGYRFDALVRHLAGDAVLEIDRVRQELAAEQAWRHRHLVLRRHLDRRMGARLVRRPARVARERVATGRMGDAVAVWRQARALRRAAS